jgi:EAL domain-containing protein (putative c-di-GMP-specific phosphodiesterase class I)
MEPVAQRLAQFREQGIKIFLDDFGLAYSSLAYLRELPLDYIKIEKTLVNDLSRAEEHPVNINQACCFDPSALVRAMITLAYGLNMSVVAKGIEN